MKVRVTPNDINRAIINFNTGKYEVKLSRAFTSSFNHDEHTNGLHKHTVYEFCVTLNGNGKFEFDNKAYSIKEKSIFVGIPHTPHEIKFTGESELTVLHFIALITKTSSKKSDTPEDKIIDSFLKSHEVISYNNPNLCDYSHFFTRKIDTSPQLIHSKIMQALFLDCIMALTSKQEIKSDKELVTEYIYANCRQKITTNDLASLLNISQRSVFSFFNKEFGQTPNEYVNKCTMSLSTQYLELGLSVSEVSDMFYFSEISSFSRMFKKYFGLTPKKYISYINANEPN